jgi:hypothetical protein
MSVRGDVVCARDGRIRIVTELNRFHEREIEQQPGLFSARQLPSIRRRAYLSFSACLYL